MQQKGEINSKRGVSWVFQVYVDASSLTRHLLVKFGYPIVLPEGKNKIKII